MMAEYHWQLNRPFIASPFRVSREIHPIRDIFKLAFLIAILAFTFKREVNAFHRKGLHGWRDASAAFIQEVGHPR